MLVAVHVTLKGFRLDIEKMNSTVVGISTSAGRWAEIPQR